MSKWHLAALAAVLLAGTVVVGVGFAQGEDPDGPNFDGQDPWFERHGPGMPHGWNGANGDGGPLHDLMIETIAEALNIPADELERRLSGGERLGEIAQEQGIDAEAFRLLMVDLREQVLKEAVVQGLMTQEQADRMLEHQLGPMGGGLEGLRPGGEVGPLHDAMREALAEALGLSVDELEQQLAVGASLDDIAQEQGVDLEVLRAAMQEARAQAIADALAEGLITQEQADRMLQRNPPRGLHGECPLDGQSGWHGRSR